jgi:hypothetical protein
MVSTKAIAATFLSGIFFANAASAAQAADTTNKLTMKPLHGVSFDVGARRAVSFYLSKNGRCELVLTLADTSDWDEDARFEATRFEASIRAGETTRYKSDEGKAVDFSCEEAAQTMGVNAVEQIATGAVR